MTVATFTIPRHPVEWELLRGSGHPDAKAARDQADWLSWLELGGTAPATLASYRWATSFLLAAFPDKTLGEFTDGDIVFVLKKFPARSRRIRKAAFDNWFRWARLTRRVDANPMDFVPNIRRPRAAVVEVFTEAEEAALKGLPEPDGTLMAILFDLGLRKSEARFLTVRRINFGEGHVAVVDGAKGSKQRVVPMLPQLSQRLAERVTLDGLGDLDHFWSSKPGGGTVIRRDQPISPTTFVRWWERCITDAGVKYRKPHTTRHTFATRWRQRGLEIDDIQALLGHASISTTSDLYVHRETVEIGVRMASLVGTKGR